MCSRPAPSAARTDSSWRRPSTRTSSRLATLAQATRSTTTMEPISTHNTLPHVADHVLLQRLESGWKCADSNTASL